MKTSRLLSTFMIAALLFVVFHDFAVNKAEATQHSSSYTLTQSIDMNDGAFNIAMEHQSFHQPFLIAPDASPFCSLSRETTLHHNETTHSQYQAFDIYSPPKA